MANPESSLSNSVMATYTGLKFKSDWYRLWEKRKKKKTKKLIISQCTRIWSSNQVRAPLCWSDETQCCLCGLVIPCWALECFIPKILIFQMITKKAKKHISKPGTGLNWDCGTYDRKCLTEGKWSNSPLPNESMDGLIRRRKEPTEIKKMYGEENHWYWERKWTTNQIVKKMRTCHRYFITADFGDRI